jgi:putative hemolysin
MAPVFHCQARGVCKESIMTTTLIAVTLLTLVISALCSLFETTLYSTRMSVLEAARTQERHAASANRFLAMKRNISRPTSAILIVNTIANTGGAAIAGMLAGEAFGNKNVPIFSVVITIAILLFAEIVPKTFGAVHWRSIWFIVVWPLAAMEKALRPLVWMTNKVSSFFIRGGENHGTTEDEIQAMIRVGAQAGSLTRNELELLSAVFKFDETVCRQIMVPWTEVARMHEDWDREKCLAMVRRQRHTRYPLTGDDDEVIGIIHVTDLISATSGTFELRKMMRPIRSVPGTMAIAQLLREMQASRLQMSIVIDEYGNDVGIITMENVIEQIVGSVRDEFDEAQPDIVREGEGAWVVRGLIPLERLNEKLGLDLPLRTDVESLSGWITGRLGRLPRVGDSTVENTYLIEVVEVMNHRAERVRISPYEPSTVGPDPTANAD